ncbi:MAG: PAS domain S-box protein [Melioribacteraceae bacterium]|nr:PAS domain S-box protein [Melioribacteraceae bacterium]MCF8354187.1 PAS domain S-box protein [Melioribacteraceae bacterium]MCF8394725.1 PAS domain S-box protein [Melioribacteraceae bacterium]MCF8418110.1 PAS domain S-box protein [Melioribacteraceae bacterium]
MKITIGKKIGFAFFILLLLLGFMGILSYNGVQDHVEQIDKMGKEIEKQIYAGNLRFTVTQVLMASSDYLATNDSQFYIDYQKQNKLLDKYYNEFIQLDLTDTEDKLLIEIKSDIDSIRYYSEKIFTFKDPRNSKTAIDYMRKIDYDLGYSINLKTTKIFDGISKRINEYKAKGDELKVYEYRNIINLIISGLLASLIFILLTINRITKPIKKLQAASEKIAEGDYSVEPVVNTKDEIASLAKSFSTMTRSISSAQHKLSENNHLLETIFKTIPTGLMIVDDNGRIMAVNKQMCDIINIDGIESVNKFLEDVLDGIKFKENCRDLMINADHLDVHECETVDSYGRTKTFRLTILPVDSKVKKKLLVADEITNLKMNQKKLEDLKQLNQSALDSLTASICVLDEQCRVIKINRSWRESASQKSILIPIINEGENYINYIKSSEMNSKPQVLKFTKGIEDVISGVIEKFEVESECDQSFHKTWVISRVTPFVESDSLPRKVVITHTDISERKNAETALKESEERYKGLFESSPVGIVVENENGDIIAVNKAIQQISGYDREELIGRNINLFVHEDQHELVKDNIRRLLNGESLQFETQSVRKDGSTIYSELFETAIQLPGGKKEIISITNDITKRREIELHNKEMAEMYSTILETTQDGFWLVDKTGKFLDVNENYCRMSGYTREELLQKGIPDLEALETPEETVQHIEYVIKRGHDRFETKHKKKNGSIWDVEINTIYWHNNEQFIAFVHNISDRKNFEFILKQNEEKYRTVADFAYNWECWQKPDGGFEYVSPSCERITGYNVSEFISKPELLSQITHPEDRHLLDSHYREITHNKNIAHEIEFRILTKDNKVKWISHVCHGVFNNDDKYLGRRGSNRDITQQKKAEEKILKLMQVIENSPLAVMLTDSQKSIEYINPHFKKLFKYTEDQQILGNSPSILRSWSTSDALYKDMWQSLNKGKSWKGILQDKCMDGTLLWLSASITPIFDHKNKVISYAAIYLDITEQIDLLEELTKYKEHLENMVSERTKELEESRETFRALAENSKDVVMRFNNKHQYLYINPAVEQFINIPAKEFIGKTNKDLKLPKHLADLFDSTIKSVFETKQNKRVEFQLPNGIWVDWLLVPEFELNGSVNTVLSSSRDITDIKKMQIEIQSALNKEKELNEMKDGFISMVSHEFRTPLTSILSSAEIIEMGWDRLEPKKKEKHFERIKNNIDSLISMLEEVVFINRSDLAKDKIVKEKIDLNKMTVDIIEQYNELYPGIKSEIKNSLDKDYYKVDVMAVKKILSNLISNAFKYNKKNGLVTVELKSKRNNLILTVKDEGTGIHPEDQKNIFEAFYRSTSVQNIQGTGLGLNIVKKLVDKQNGRISFLSIPNDGTEFTVLIPLL